MANRKLRIVAHLSGSTRSLLLRMAKPRLPTVFCEHVTYAYGIGADHPFPKRDCTVAIWGIHRTPSHEALLCTVNGAKMRSDGKLFHITLSTDTGVAPAAAGNINEAAVEEVSPVEFTVHFTIGHACVSRGQLDAKLRAAA